MNVLQAVSMTQKDEVVQGLRRVTLIDVGYILEYNGETNLAKVQAAGMQEGASRIYSNVEVLFAGCMRNGLQGAVEGSACLLFVPRSTSDPLSSFTISDNRKEYTTYKCLPVFTPLEDTPVNFSIQEDGSILFDTDEYDLAIKEDCVVLASDDGKAQEYWSPTYKKSVMKGEQITWVDTVSNDGTREMCQYKDNALLNKISIAADGTISVENDKSISITSKETMTATADGGAVTITGKGVTVDAGSGMLTLKNTQSSVFAVLNSLLTLLNGGTVATAGSETSQLVTAGQFTSQVQELAKIMNA